MFVEKNYEEAVVDAKQILLKTHAGGQTIIQMVFNLVFRGF